MRRDTKEAWPSLVSHTTLFLHSLTPVHSVYCLVLFVRGYGWKRLDFDIFLEDRQSGLPLLQRFLHCSAEGSELDCFENSEVADLSPWGDEFVAASRSCSAVIAAVVSSTLRTRRERESDLSLSFCILRNDWEKSFENFDLIEEELIRQRSFDCNCLQSSSRMRLRKFDLLAVLIQWRTRTRQLDTCCDCTGSSWSA